MYGLNQTKKAHDGSSRRVALGPAGQEELSDETPRVCVLDRVVDFCGLVATSKVLLLLHPARRRQVPPRRTWPQPVLPHLAQFVRALALGLLP